MVQFRSDWRGSLFSPWTVNILHWAMIIGGILLLPNTLYPLTGRFWTSIAIWLVIVSAGSWLLYAALPAPSAIRREPVLSRAGFDALMMAALVLTPLYLMKIYHQVIALDDGNLLDTTRKLALENRSYGPVSYCVVIDQVLFVAAWWAGKGLKWWKKTLVTVLYALCGVAIMEKGTFVFMILVMLIALYERKVIKLRHLAVVVAVTVVVAFSFTVSRMNDYQRTHTSMNRLDRFVEVYLLASPVAYCYMPEGGNTQIPGENTLSVVYYLLDKLPFVHCRVAPREQAFIYVPAETNTYTVLQPFYQDFGQAGVALFALVYAVIFGLAYRYYRNGGTFAAILYGYLIGLFCMQFHQEEIFLGLMRLIQFSFFALILSIPVWKTKKQTY